MEDAREFAVLNADARVSERTFFSFSVFIFFAFSFVNIWIMALPSASNQPGSTLPAKTRQSRLYFGSSSSDPSSTNVSKAISSFGYRPPSTSSPLMTPSAVRKGVVATVEATRRMLVLSDNDDDDSMSIQRRPKKRRMRNHMLADDSDEDDSTSTAATTISNATSSESDPDGKIDSGSVTEDNEDDQRQPMEHGNGDDSEDDDAFMDVKANTNRRLDASSTSHKVALLREEFPTLARDDALLALSESGGDFTKTMQHLKISHSQQQSSPSPPPRKRLVRRIDSSESDGDDDDEDEAARALEIEHLKQAVQTVTFYNTCRPQEMMDVTGCNLGAVEKMIRLRPFENLEDLKDKLKQERGLSLKYVTDYMEVLEGYSAVDQIIQNIEDIGGQLQTILDVWQQSGSSGDDDGNTNDAGTHLVDVDINNGQVDTSSALYKDAMDGFLTQQPDSVNPDFTLKSYQITGVNWMLLLYRKGISGILADEMGLGKTAQVISFLGRLQELGESGPHLIVVPSSTLDNWMREFDRFCPTLEVRCYYGSQNERRELQQDIMYDRDTIHAVVTTYAIAAGRVEDRSFLRRLRCKSMILDEGHMIKNYTSARYGHLMRLDTPFRLLLTGTPLQNNLQELVSLLIFIMPKVFSGSEDDVRKIFKLKAGGGSESSNKASSSSGIASSTTATTATNTAQMLSRQRIERAKKMMTPFVLRRRKAQVLIHMPKKIHHVDYCPMTPKQHTMYAQIVADSQDRYNDVAKDDTNKKMEKFNNIVMQLRKAADHPLLFRHIYTDDKLKVMAKEIRKEERYWDSEEQYILEDMEVMTDFELNRLCRDHKVSREKKKIKPRSLIDTFLLFSPYDTICLRTKNGWILAKFNTCDTSSLK